MAVRVRRLVDTSFGEVLDSVDVRVLDEDSWKGIEEAFHRSGVIVLKGQSLSVDEQIAFAGRFGNIEVQSGQTVRPGLEGKPLVLDISNVDVDGRHITDRNHPLTRYLAGNEGWHSDSSFKPVTAKASMLHCIEAPSRGGETGYADARDGDDLLDESEWAELSRLRVYHSLEYSQALAKATDDDVPEGSDRPGRGLARPGPKAPGHRSPLPVHRSACCSGRGQVRRSQSRAPRASGAAGVPTAPGLLPRVDAR